MSAFVVCKAHIDALVTARRTAKYDPLTTVECNTLGQLLWDENHKSVNFRYRNSDKAELTPRYTFRENKRTDVEVLKACDCLEYQSCEHDGWKDSKAKQELEHLRGIIIARLPGYDDAPWAID